VYLSTTRAADEANGIAAAPRRSGRRGRRGRVSGNVLALGAVSLVTDSSTEMVNAILPIYLLVGLGLSPFAVGVVGGVNALGSLLLRLVGGHVADRTQRRKGLAGVGYGLGAVAKVVLLAAGSSLGWIGAAVGLDRLGKGLRTAPRDALISLSSPPDDVGRAFGVHRAMDTVGALLGPIVAFLVIFAWPGRYDVVFVVSFCLAVLAVVILALFVRDRRDPSVSRSLVSVRAAAGLARDRNLRRICLCAGALGLVTIGDAFVYLLLQRRLDVTVSSFALLPLGTAAVFLVLAAPLGRLADRVGRWRVYLGGYAALFVAYALLAGLASGRPLLVGVLALYGIYYAATDGVLMAVATPHLPAALRTTGMALVQTCSVGASLVAALAFGLGWSLAGPQVVLVAFTVGLVLMLGVAVVLAPRAARAETTA
jgi:MFS family permease